MLFRAVLAVTVELAGEREAGFRRKLACKVRIESLAHDLRHALLFQNRYTLQILLRAVVGEYGGSFHGQAKLVANSRHSIVAYMDHQNSICDIGRIHRLV